MAAVNSEKRKMPPLEFYCDNAEAPYHASSPMSQRVLRMRVVKSQTENFQEREPQSYLSDVTTDVDSPKALSTSVFTDNVPTKMEKMRQKLIQRAFKESHVLRKIQKLLNKPVVKSYVGVIRDELGHTILHRAIIQGRRDVVELLYYMGFWKQLYDQAVMENKGSQYSGMTSLQLAEALAEDIGLEEVANSVLSSVRFFQKVSQGMDTDMERLLRGCVEAGWRLKQMEDTDTLNRITAGGYGPFLFAVASGEVGLVSAMLSRRVNFKVTTERIENALHIATKLGRIAMVDMLLHRDLCDPEDRDIDNLRPIEYAILNSDQETLEVFVKHSVHPDEECLELARRVYHQGRDRELRRELGKKKWQEIKMRPSREDSMIAYITNHIHKDKTPRRQRVDSAMLKEPCSACMDESMHESGAEVTSPSTADKRLSISSPEHSPEKNDEVKKLPANAPPHIVAGIIHRMLLSDAQHYPYDIQSALTRTSAPIEKLLDNQGHSILHNIVIAAKPEFLSMVFYLGTWGVLRDQQVDENSSSDYKGMTPRKVAEKLLPCTKGPELLDEFDHYDELWDSLPELSRVCLLGEEYAIQHIIHGAENPTVVLNETDTSGFNCLPYAVASGSLRAVQLLINSGADVRLLNDRNQNALHIAAMLGRDKVIPLLTATSDVSLPDKSNCKPVDYAASNGNEEMMKAFREQGVQPDNVSVSLAARHGRSEMVRHLLDTYSLDMSGRDCKGRTPLLAAAANGHLSTVKLLLERGADITATDKQWRNCLHLSVESKIWGCIPVLLEHAKEKNCDSQILNQQDYFSGNGIIVLVRGHGQGCLAWLYVQVERDLVHKFNAQLKRGIIDVKHCGRVLKSGFGRSPDRTVRDQMEEFTNKCLAECTPDMTPLHMAAFQGKEEAIKAFLEAGANPNIQDSFGLTPLHLVAMRGYFKIAETLKDYKAEFHRKSKDGKTAADVASNNDHVKLENYIRQLEYDVPVKEFRERLLDKLEKELSGDVLEILRQEGKNVRRHVIDVLRGVSIDVNEQLFDLGSGPIMEATPDEP